MQRIDTANNHLVIHEFLLQHKTPNTHKNKIKKGHNTQQNSLLLVNATTAAFLLSASREKQQAC